jgi:DNA-binding IclR family transcriptional regulator
MMSLNDSSSTSDDEVPRSIGRVLDLLEIVVTRGRCTLTEAADAAGLTPTTGRRYLQALVTRGYVERASDGGYLPGPAIRTVATALRGNDDAERLAIRAQHHLERLAANTGESAYLGVIDADDATYVATAESDRAIRHVGWVGQRVPLAGTAIGAAIAAPGATAVRRGAVEADISAVSLCLGGAWSGRAAVSIVGPSHRFTDDAVSRLEAELIDAVAAIDHDLGMNTASPTDRGDR